MHSRHKRHVSVVGASLLAAVVVTDADAADLPPSFELGARSGFGLPLGDATGEPNADFDKLISNIVPIWLDMGARPTPNWYFGAYLAYGFGSQPSSAASACATPRIGCSFHDTRVGVNVQYHVTNRALDPWFGLGIGYEWYNFDESFGGLSASVSASGWEFVNVQLGLDYKPAPTVGIGPFAALSLAQFDNASLASGRASEPSQSIPHRALHEWLIFGVRIIFDVPAVRTPASAQ